MTSTSSSFETCSSESYDRFVTAYYDFKILYMISDFNNCVYKGVSIHSRIINWSYPSSIVYGQLFFNHSMNMTHIPRLSIALVSERKSAYLDLGYSAEQCAALTHDGEIEAVLTTLESLGHHVTLIPGIESLVQRLAAGTYKSWDLVFNMAQGFHGSAREAQVPALLEAYQIPFTFSDAATIAFCQNKVITKVRTRI